MCGVLYFYRFSGHLLFKGPYKNLPTLPNLITKGLKGKTKPPVYCCCCACVFHSVSCVARVDTITVQISQAHVKYRLWFSAPEFGISKAEKKHFSNGHRRSLSFPVRKPVDGNISWLKIQDTPCDSPCLLAGFPVLLESLYKTSFNPAPPW